MFNDCGSEFAGTCIAGDDVSAVRAVGVRTCANHSQGGVEKFNDSYSKDSANLSAVGLHRLLQAVLDILIGCERLLRPGGIVAMTVRPWRHRGVLVDLPGTIGSLADRAGLDLFERNVALLAGLRSGQLVPRASFFAMDHARKSRERGDFPRLVIAHEDVLVFRKPS